MEDSIKRRLDLKPLEDYQREALAKFRRYGYVVVESPRQAGKTMLLKYIIAQNMNKSFGFIGDRQHFQREYARIPVLMDFLYDRGPKDGFRHRDTYDIILADEVLVNPYEFGNVKVACVFTRRFIITSWRNKARAHPPLDLTALRMQLGDHEFEVEFGRD